MGLSISHLDKKANGHLENFFKECFKDHILEHFKMEPSEVEAHAVYGHDGPKHLLRVSFNYRNEHIHAREIGENPYGISLKAIRDIEKQINKLRKKNLALKRAS
mgnify:CR=1 FL=1